MDESALLITSQFIYINRYILYLTKKYLKCKIYMYNYLSLQTNYINNVVVQQKTFPFTK